MIAFRRVLAARRISNLGARNFKESVMQSNARGAVRLHGFSAAGASGISSAGENCTFRSGAVGGADRVPIAHNDQSNLWLSFHVFSFTASLRFLFEFI